MTVFAAMPGSCIVVDCVGGGWVMLIVDEKRLGLVCELCAWVFGDMIEHLPVAQVRATPERFEGWKIYIDPADLYGAVLRRRR